MRQILNILACLTILLPFVSLGQINSKKIIENDDCIALFDTLTNLTVFSIVDRMPEPTEGEQSLYEKIAKIKIKPTIREPLTGKIIVAFIVTTNADLIGKRVVQDINGTDYSNQILKIIDEVDWTVGYCKETPVPVLYHLPVRFKNE
jgi:hypothetical protein